MFNPNRREHFTNRLYIFHQTLMLLLKVFVNVNWVSKKVNNMCVC